ncbi:Serine carboxypeptidase-like 20 [Turnera subulata]|uniref:Carboxypeptidase n=1 Tax=Turnera subulata TaxID=218843 RepID=A0A9Q0GCW1_9ROSI|nr:Serine carboxypeptidase-like 20 [Turnera subulata]
MEKMMYKLHFWGISLCMLLSFAFIGAIPNDTLITSLPGFNGAFPSNHYSGYISFDEKNLFYYFIVSERNPSTDPVVLWLNGGPGCSSFDGFVYEHGPFNFEDGGSDGGLPKLHLNPYSWSKVSNIIYLDSPCGVGLSYSPNPSKYETDDFKTAADTHNFLLKWFGQYPEFVNNPFFISGESYAGVYVPTLASEVVKGINAGVSPIINFKGYLVGNGVSNSKYEGIDSFISFVRGMGLISGDIFQEIQAACNGNYNNRSASCEESLEKVDQAVWGLNIYDILEPCYHDPSSSAAKGNTSLLPTSFKELGKTEKPLKVRKRYVGRAWPYWRHGINGDFPMWSELASAGVPCVDDHVATKWLNDESVRKAIHAQPVSIAGPWELCSDRISYGFGAGSLLPFHKNLTSQGYRALIYSGDHDMCVPFTGTEAWTKALGYKTVDEWRPWLSDSQVAGYLQGYDHNLTFLTIKGAGHTVPEYKPRESLDFFTRFLDGKPI